MASVICQVSCPWKEKTPVRKNKKVRLAKEQEVVAIEQSLLDQQVAIATLVGAGMPAIALPPPGDQT